ncbi:response regulator transcription factor [Algoriphagus sp.]|uniref:response regulator transcription factor n=1 Tax=Algoriphagus sp. TaxID=1872435 RepID=UPI00391BD337
MNEAPRILIIEDEPLIAEDIADLCQLNGYKVCGTAYSASMGLKMINTHSPSLVLLDINLQDRIDGLEIANFLKDKYEIPFIFLTSYSDRETLAQVKKTSPLGYIVKPFNKEQLFSTIELALAQMEADKNRELDFELIDKKLPEPLSAREREVLSCMFKGMSTKTISETLFISTNTVKFHLKNLFEKIEAHNRVELLVKLKSMMGK